MCLTLLQCLKKGLDKMKCRYKEECDIPHQPANCKLTGGVCGMCNHGDYTFCIKITELENAIFGIERLLSSSATTKDQIRNFIKAVKRDIIDD